SFSGRAKREPQAAKACALGVILASSVMGLRVLAVVAIINRGLLLPVALPVGALTIAGFVAAAILYLGGKKEVLAAENVKLSTPFDRGSAPKSGLPFTIVLVASKAATQPWGAQGSYLAALLGGAADVDAVTISLSRLSASELPPRMAALAIFIACAA